MRSSESCWKAVCSRAIAGRLDPPSARRSPGQREFLEDADEQILEYDNALPIGTLRERQGVGARERLEEVGVLCHVDPEAVAGKIPRPMPCKKGCARQASAVSRLSFQSSSAVTLTRWLTSSAPARCGRDNPVRRET